ncbi:MAG TPA: hypothetical protein VFF73_39425 [Planctomycetota bacterium]|nr:hypothetical protein [Planctomycetota bacterium]
MSDSLLTHAISELGSGDLRTLLARTERSLRGRASELRPRLREAVLAGELAPEDLLRRLDEDALSALAAGLELSRAPKHQELVRALALAIEREPRDVPRRPRRQGHVEASNEVERLQADVDRLLDERARLEAKTRSLERELETVRGASGTLDEAPADLGDLLRSIGIADKAAYKRLYRPAVKLLHPDKSKDGEAAFRLLTRIKELLDGRA